MNTLLPVYEKLRGLCLTKLTACGLLRRKKRRAEVQLEFRWR